jgi:hypothetical protein
MTILAGILGTMNLWLPNLINLAEVLHSKMPKSGQAKLSAVLTSVATAATVAGVVDPGQQSLIQGIATTAINTTVAINNLVKNGGIPATTAANAATLVPAIATPNPAAANTTS